MGDAHLVIVDDYRQVVGRVPTLQDDLIVRHRRVGSAADQVVNASGTS